MPTMDGMVLELDAYWAEVAEWHGYVLSAERQWLLTRHTFRTRVAGVHYHLEDAQDASFAPGSPLVLRPEPENPHDLHAVSVWNELGTLTIGYLPRGVAGDLHECEGHRTGLVLDELLEDGQRVEIGILVSRETVGLRVALAPPHCGHVARSLSHRSSEQRSLDLIHESARTVDPVEQMARMLEAMGGRQPFHPATLGE